MKTLIKFLSFLLSGRLLAYLFKMTQDGYLAERGWLRSFLEKKPVNAAGNPLPWITLSCSDFITPRLTKDLDVLEFGSGFSTLFYSKRVRQVTAIESNEFWYNRVKNQLTSGNIQLLFKTGASYWECLGELKKRYHIMVVDGDERLKCTQAAVNYLLPEGVIMLDNSLRPEYQPIYEFLGAKGFRHIDFWGLAPGSRKTNCTTIFYKAENCLHI